MFVLKFFTKLILVPVWLVLLIIWLPVHLAVSICGMLHGFGKLFFGGLAVLAIVLGMWPNAMLFTAFIVGTFIFTLLGSVLEVLLEEARHMISTVMAR